MSEKEILLPLTTSVPASIFLDLLQQTIQELSSNKSLLGLQFLDSPPGWPTLTLREKQILHLISLRLTTRQIAVRLHSSHKTVTNQRTSINQKLGLTGAFCLLQFVAEHRHWLIANPPVEDTAMKKG